MKTDVLGQVKRYVLLCVGLTIMAFGVAFSIKAGYLADFQPALCAQPVDASNSGNRHHCHACGAYLPADFTSSPPI